MNLVEQQRSCLVVWTELDPPTQPLPTCGNGIPTDTDLMFKEESAGERMSYLMQLNRIMVLNSQDRPRKQYFK